MAAGVDLQPPKTEVKAEEQVGGCQVAEASSSTETRGQTSGYQVVEASQPQAPGTSKAAPTEQPPTSSQQDRAAAVALALEATEKEWQVKMNIFSRENAEKVIEILNTSTTQETKDALVTTLEHIEQSADESILYYTILYYTIL